MEVKRTLVINTVNSWVGFNEADGSYKKIIDIYNSYRSGMLYSWPWCACCASAAFIANGYGANEAPIEISCPRMVALAQQRKDGAFEWIEDESVMPELGWLVLYDWEDNGVGDNKGNPDHVGIVTYVNAASGYFVVTEGNYSDSVKKRTIDKNGKFLRGFVKIGYSDGNNVGAQTIAQRTADKTVSEVAHEVITGLWGNGEARKKNLEAKGYSYTEVQAEVNRILNGSAATGTVSSQKAPTESKVTTTCYATKFDKTLAKTYKTTSAVYVRNDAGTDKKALAQLPKGAKATCYGYYNLNNKTKWLLCQAPLNGVLYTGFICEDYLA